MKRCPECRRDYHDDTLLYCLDDGNSLLEGPASMDEPATAMFGVRLSGNDLSDQKTERIENISTERPLSSSGAPNNSIAVLPFVNMSADPENEYFCDGLAEELLNAFAKIDDLKVAARTSAFSFKGKDTHAGEIAHALNVRTVLEGSVRKSGNRIRITVQLINALDGYHIWSEVYDREMRDIFDVQDEITLSVVEALKVKLLGQEKTAILKRYTSNPEAYQLFLKGRYHWYTQIPESVMKSGDYFQQAIELDPSYVPGYAGLSEFYGMCSALGMVPPDDGWPKAEAAMMRAQQLDDTLPEVHNGLAAIRMFYYRDWAGTEREIGRAIELNPDFAEVHLLNSVYLAVKRRPDESIAEAKLALKLDPLSPTYQQYLGRWFYYCKQYEAAIDKYSEALKLRPNNIISEELGDIFEHIGRNDEAFAAWRQAAVLAGDDELAAILDKAYVKGDLDAVVKAMAHKRLDRVEMAASAGSYVPAIQYVRPYIRLGDTEQAFRWLTPACEDRNMFPLFIALDPFYDSLRPDPRYPGILESIGLPN